jgi:hypothetical protein
MHLLKGQQIFSRAPSQGPANFLAVGRAPFAPTGEDVLLRGTAGHFDTAANWHPARAQRATDASAAIPANLSRGRCIPPPPPSLPLPRQVQRRPSQPHPRPQHEGAQEQGPRHYTYIYPKAPASFRGRHAFFHRPTYLPTRRNWPRVLTCPNNPPVWVLMPPCSGVSLPQQFFETWTRYARPSACAGAAVRTPHHRTSTAAVPYSPPCAAVFFSASARRLKLYERPTTKHRNCCGRDTPE